MALAGHHLRRRVPLPAPRPGRARRTTTRTRWATRCAPPRPTPASGSPCSTPATSPGAIGAAARRARSSGSATATSSAWAERVARDGTRTTATSGSARPSTPCAPCPPTRPGGRRLGAAARRPLHVHLSEQPAENEACLAAYGCTPTALLREHGVLGAAHHRGARHPPDRRRHRLLGAQPAPASASARPPNATSATGSVPRRRAADAGSPLVPRQRQPRRRSTCSRRRAALELARAAGSRERGRFSAGRAAGGRHRRRSRALWAGPTRADRGRRAGRPGRRRPRLASAPPGAGPTETPCSRATAADVTDVVVDGRAGRRATASTSGSVAVGRAAGRRDRRAVAGGDADEPRSSSPASASSSPTTQRSVTARRSGIARRTPPWSSTDGRVAWVGPRGRRPAADARVDVGGRAVIPGFVDSHAHLVFAGRPQRGVRRPDDAGSPTTPAASRPPSPPPARPPTTRCAPTSARLVAETAPRRGSPPSRPRAATA